MKAQRSADRTAPTANPSECEIYRDVLARLLATGEAYEAYSTPEEVEARHLAAGRNPKLGYDNYDRDLTDEQRASFRAEGRRPVIRLRMPDTDLAGATWCAARCRMRRAVCRTSH